MPLNTKTGKEVAQAFLKLFPSGSPNRLWTDKGTEFYNQQLKAVLAANDVTLYSTENCGTLEQNDEEYHVEVLYCE